MGTAFEDLKSSLMNELEQLEQYQIKRDRLTIPKKSEIGRGGFATVQRADLDRRTVPRRTGTTVAVKQLFPPNNRGTHFLHVANALAREVSILGPLEHPNIVPFIGFHLDFPSREAWLVFGFAENGTVIDYIQERAMTDMGERLELVKDTISGLQYLHTRSPPICHGDIKANNVLVNGQGRAMLCDFGLSSLIGPAPSGLTTTGFKEGGTTRYQCKELLSKGNRRTLKTDIWAWGCLTLEICTGNAPFHSFSGEAAVINQIDKGAPPADLSEVDLPEHVRQLLAQCWAVDPDGRPNATDCLDVMTIDDRRAFKEKPIWESSTVVDVLERDLTAILKQFDYLRLRRPLFTFVNPEYGNEKGSVHRATLKKGLFSPTTDVAVKILHVSGDRAKCIRMLLSLIRELGVWATLNHHNILPFAGFYLNSRFDEAWFASPFLENGDILAYIERHKPNSLERTELIQDIAEGLKYLHGLNPPVCHGDVKPGNILVDNNRCTLLCDFGLARSIEGMPSGLTTSSFDQGGAIAYLSPELFAGTSRRSRESDVWAWGCVAHEIFSGRGPFHGIDSTGTVAEHMRSGLLPADVHDTSLPLPVQLTVACCWNTDPIHRPTMSTCLSWLAMLEPFHLQELQLLYNADEGGEQTRGFHEASLQNSKQKVKVTVVAKKQVLGNHTAQDALQWLSRWNSMLHHNTHGLLGFYTEGTLEKSLLIFSAVSGLNVNQYIMENRLGQKERMQLVYGVTYGLCHMHAQDPPLCHGALSPYSILIGPKHQAVICDAEVISLSTDIEVDELVRYSSPEVVNGSLCVLAGDVWAWACVSYEILSSQTPYADAVDLASINAAIQAKRQPALLSGLELSKELQELLQKSWNWHMEERPLIAACIQALERPKLIMCSEVKLDHKDVVAAIALSCDGKLLAVWSQSAEIKIYLVRYELLLRTFVIDKPQNWHQLSFSTDSQLLIDRCGSSFKVWSVRGGQIKYIIEENNFGSITAYEMSPNKTFIAVGDASGTIHMCYAQGIGMKFEISGKVRSISISENSHIIAACGGGKAVRVWMIDNQALLISIDILTAPRCIKLSLNGQWLVGSNNESIHIWDITQNPARSLVRNKWAAEPLRTTDIVISPNGLWVVLSSGDKKHWIIRTTGHHSLTCLEQLSGSISYLTPISSCGEGFIAAYNDSNAVAIAQYNTFAWAETYQQ